CVVFVVSGSVNWNWPGEISMAGPNGAQLGKGKKMSVLPITVNGAPIILVNSNCTEPVLFIKTVMAGAIPSRLLPLEAHSVSDTYRADRAELPDWKEFVIEAIPLVSSGIWAKKSGPFQN